MEFANKNNIEDRNYTLSYSEVFNESWRLYSKLIGVGAIAVLLYGVASQMVSMVMSAITGINQLTTRFAERIQGVTDPGAVYYEMKDLYMENSISFISSQLGTQLIMLLAFPLAGGFMLVCREADRTGVVDINKLFEGFKPYYWSRLMTLAVVYFIISKIALLFFFIPGIYVWVAGVIACPIVMFNDYDGISALKASFKLVNKNWFTVFQVLFVASLFGILGYFICVVGRIFTYPLVLVSVYVLYKYIVGFPKSEIDEIGQE